MRNLSKDVQSTALNLGVSDAVKARLLRIETLAEEGSWPAVRYEIEFTVRDLSESLRAVRDADLAELVILGQWLRTFEVGAQVVTAKDFENLSICIGGEGLIERIMARLKRLDEKVRADEAVSKAQRQLDKIARNWQPLPDGGSEPSDALVKDTLERVRAIMKEFSRPS